MRRCCVKIHLERAKCSGHAQCYIVDAAFFPIDDEGYSTMEERTVEPGEEDVARRGVTSCPENALVIDEDG
jgi:ferredoxin